MPAPALTTSRNAVAAVLRRAAALVADEAVDDAGLPAETPHDVIIRHLATHDALTGLPNRGTLNARLTGAMAAAPSGRLAMLSLDLDGLKAVNDALGHAAGDALLQQVAQRLRAATAPGDFAARLGGDEFVVIRPGASRADAAGLAAELTRNLARPYEIEGRSVEIGVSIGIALAPSDGVTATELMRNADAALDLVKRERVQPGSARRRWNFFQRAMEAQRRDRAALESDLRAAARTGRGLALHYQPVHDAAGRVVGQEALMRWTHPERGPIPPTEFIPLAEESDLILELGRWALNTACAAAVGWPEAWRVSVNLSPVQFTWGGLLSEVRSALELSGLPGHRLELEVTESVLIRDTARVLDTMRTLHGLGICFALDDFGTGYASLSTLRSYPFTRLKIDRSFLNGFGCNEQVEPMLQAILSLAAALQLSVVAEGVETPDQLAALRRLGCQEFQGFLLGRPAALVTAEMLAA